MKKQKLSRSTNEKLEYTFFRPIFSGDNSPESFDKNNRFSLYAKISGGQNITRETARALKRDFKDVKTYREKDQICLECSPKILTKWSVGYDKYWMEGSVFDGGGSGTERKTEGGIVLPHENFTFFDGRVEFSLTSPMKRLLKKHYMSFADEDHINGGKWYHHFYFVLCDKHSEQIEKTSNKLLERLLNNEPFSEDKDRGEGFQRITLDKINTHGFGKDLRSCREAAKIKIIKSMPITKYMKEYGRYIGDQDGSTYP